MDTSENFKTSEVYQKEKKNEVYQRLRWDVGAGDLESLAAGVLLF